MLRGYYWRSARFRSLGYVCERGALLFLVGCLAGGAHFVYGLLVAVGSFYHKGFSTLDSLSLFGLLAVVGARCSSWSSYALGSLYRHGFLLYRRRARISWVHGVLWPAPLIGCLYIVGSHALFGLLGSRGLALVLSGCFSIRLALGAGMHDPQGALRKCGVLYVKGSR